MLEDVLFHCTKDKNSIEIDTIDEYQQFLKMAQKELISIREFLKQIDRNPKEIETRPHSKNPSRDTQKRILDTPKQTQQWIFQFVASMRRKNYSISTIKSNLGQVLLFIEFLPKEKAENLIDVTRRDIESYIEFCQDRELKENTINRKLDAVGSFYHFLVDLEQTKKNPINYKLHMKVPDPIPKALNDQQVEKLLEALPKEKTFTAYRDKAMILILLRTGMRAGELVNIKLQDIDIPHDRIFIPLSNKNGQGRRVYITDDAKQNLENWLEIRNQGYYHNSKYLFFSSQRPKFSYAVLRSIFIKYRQKAGLDDIITLHALRHTFATQLLNSGMRLEALQKLMGHHSILVTQRYARLSEETKRKEYFDAMAKIQN